MVISFCGHRDFSADEEKEKLLIKILIEQAHTENEVICYTGGYGLFDAFAAQCIRKAQNTASNIRNCLIIPYITTSHLEKISIQKNKFDEIIYPPLENTPYKYAIIRRNEWMIQCSDLLIAYVKRDWGGAARSLEYAKKQRKHVINIATLL